VTGILRAHVTRLAATLADLRERVRAAVAGELARAVGESVRQVVEAVVAGRVEGPRPVPLSTEQYPRPSRWGDDPDDDHWGRARDPWDDDEYPDTRDVNRVAPVRRGDETPARPAAAPAVPAAVAAGVYLARWWVGRRGTLLGAAGLGLGVGLLGVVGGPVLRAAIAALAAAADILSATAALGSGAARLAPL
jgi:hypothetical protein